jgi:hypothetical protein
MIHKRTGLMNCPIKVGHENPTFMGCFLWPCLYTTNASAIRRAAPEFVRESMDDISEGTHKKRTSALTGSQTVNER